MFIQWFGQACFLLQGDKSSVVMDPFDPDFVGLKLPRLSADIVTISHEHQDHNNIDGVKGTESNPKPFTITDPGEYELKSTFVYGIPAYHDGEQGKDRGRNIIYRIEIDGVSIGHLGDLGHPLEQAQIEKLDGVDILLIPVGGVYTIDAGQAIEVISQIEPRIVIPMHYQIPGLKLKGGKNLDPLDPFCKKIGICPAEALSKYKISKKDLPQDLMQVVLLQP